MLSYVEFYQPRYVLMENVKGLLQHHSLRSVSEMGDEEDEEGKTVKMSIVKFVLRALLRLGLVHQPWVPLCSVSFV
jgi:DNA (cytosine-5)-methyltransferase 1